jgi:hypothetical protein
MMNTMLPRWSMSLVVPAVLLVLSALPGIPGSARAQNVGYVANVEDLPLMPGLSEIAGAGLVFDKPEGRIVEAYARGSLTPEAVLAFYRRSLPQLGWVAAGPAAYHREGERLDLEVLGQDTAGTVVVRFSLSPE